MLSFCQGTFYGLGTYVVAWLAEPAGRYPALILVAAFVAGGCVAGLIGLVLVRMSGHSFTIATVIVAVVGFLGGNTLRDFTGGEDGLAFSLSGSLWAGQIHPEEARLYLSLLVLLTAVVGLAAVLGSTWGKIIMATRENEMRARFLGYDVRAWRLGLWTVGGGVAALAGALYAVTAGHTSTANLEIGLSVNVILWSVVGGLGTLAGPIVGVTLLLPLTDYLSSSLATIAQIPVGVLLILVIVLMPDGLLGVLGEGRLERRRQAAANKLEAKEKRSWT